ncbi:MAG: hypothetical protein RLZ35_583 [Pseudomonadota bacterium]|jgi:repressor LexA
MMTKLTKRQAEILALIENQLSKKGSPPTRAEIARLMGFRSPNAAEDHLRALAKKKVIELIPGTSRGIRLLQPSDSIPLIKDIKRFSHLTADRLPQETQLNVSALVQEATLSIAMPDNSLASEGVHEGDILLVQLTQSPPANRILLLKKQGQFYFERISASMLTLNRQAGALADPSIEGYVIGSIRTY